MIKIGDYVEWVSAKSNIWQILECSDTMVQSCKLVFSKTTPECIGEINGSWDFDGIRVLSEEEIKRLKLEAL